jgi:hypothetical protein
MSRPHIATLINDEGHVLGMAKETATLLPSKHEEERGRRRRKPRCELGKALITHMVRGEVNQLIRVQSEARPVCNYG